MVSQPDTGTRFAFAMAIAALGMAAYFGLGMSDWHPGVRLALGIPWTAAIILCGAFRGSRSTA